MMRSLQRLIQTALAVALTTSAVTSRTARAQPEVWALYTETPHRGGWQYDYTLKNGLPSAAFANFTLFSVSFTLDRLTSASTLSLAPGWTSFITADFLEVFSLNIGPPPFGTEIPFGESLSGFTFLFNRPVGDLPFVASFADSDDPDTVYQFAGISSAAATAPEPATQPYLLLGAAALAARGRRHRASRNGTLL